MKKLRFLPLSIISLLVIGCNGLLQPSSNSSSDDCSSSDSSSSDSSSDRYEPEISTPIEKDVEVRMVTHFGEDFGNSEYNGTCHYSDYWFFEDSYRLNYELALMSAMAGGASYSSTSDNNGSKTASLLEQTGFKNIRKNYYYSNGLKLENSIGTIIGSKAFKDANNKTYTLLAVFPRNAGYELEWAGNFNMGKTGIHEGFKETRDEMLRFMKEYIDTAHISGDLKVWSIGYSRGAATANLFGGFLAEESGYFGDNIKLDSHDVYVYTIGTPNAIPNNCSKVETLSVSGPREEEYKDTNVPAFTYTGSGNINPNADQYKGIHNFVATGDYVAKLPPEAWGITRYGVTESVTYGSDDMLAYLEELSPDTANKFKGKNYETKVTLQTFDLVNFEFKDTDQKKSADDVLNERIAALMGLKGSREAMVDAGYIDALGQIAAIYGSNSSIFSDLAEETGSLIKVVLLNYLAYVIEAKGSASESEAIADLMMDVMGLCGKEVRDRTTYTDQQFLADLLDYLINDYQTSEVAKARSKNIAAMIPAPYDALYTDLLVYAKEKNYAPKTIDGLIELLANYVNDNKDNPTVDSLLGSLASLVPSEYITYVGLITGKQYSISDYESEAAMHKAIMFDLLNCLAKGRYDDDGTEIVDAQTMRNAILNLVGAIAFPNCPKLTNLLLNGSYSYGEKVEKDPALLAELVPEILSLVLSKDEEGNTLTIVESADAALVDLLEKARNEKNDKYIDGLQSRPELVRDILIALVINPGNEYDLSSDIVNIMSVINAITFVFPAHNHEMYICYLKTKIQSTNPQ